MYGHHDNVDVRTDEVIAVDPAAPSVTFADGETLGARRGRARRRRRGRTSSTRSARMCTRTRSTASRTRSGCARASCSCSRTPPQRPELAARGSLTFVVVGGGPTGVETAGALAELVHDVMPRAYANLSSGARPGDPGRPRAGRPGRLLRPGARVRRASSCGTAASTCGWASRPRRSPRTTSQLSDGTIMPTQLVVWGGGETAAPLAARAGVPSRVTAGASTSTRT